MSGFMGPRGSELQLYLETHRVEVLDALFVPRRDIFDDLRMLTGLHGENDTAFAATISHVRPILVDLMLKETISLDDAKEFISLLGVATEKERN